MKRLLVFFLGVASAWGIDWRSAVPGWSYEFPRDHQLHQEFKTEWWYFTGNLTDTTGGRCGYELTFFREGIIPPAERDSERSRFVVNDLKFAHFTVTDARGRRFRFAQKASRGAFGEAGFNDGNRMAWIDDWSLELTENGTFHIRATTEAAAIDLVLVPVKPPVVHGENGVSVKAGEPDHASHYYSVTRLRTAGRFRCEAATSEVSGESWFDHEWATNQLAHDQVGWNWLSAQFADGSELMLYQMRRRDGEPDPASSGTLVTAEGLVQHLSARDFSLQPTRRWVSGATGAEYPIEWRVSIPAHQLQLAIKPVLDNQELVLPPLTYWEGAVDLMGNRSGVGYLEMTGYATPLRALTR